MWCYEREAISLRAMQHTTVRGAAAVAWRRCCCLPRRPQLLLAGAPARALARAQAALQEAWCSNHHSDRRQTRK